MLDILNIFHDKFTSVQSNSKQRLSVKSAVSSPLEGVDSELYS